MTRLEIHFLHHRLRHRTPARRIRPAPRAEIAGRAAATAADGAAAGAAVLGGVGHDFNFVGDGIAGAEFVGGGAGDFAVEGFVVDALDAGYGDRGGGGVGAGVAFAGGGEVVVVFCISVLVYAW